MSIGSGNSPSTTTTATQNNDNLISLFKIVVIGDAKVGKTSLMNRYVKGMDYDVTRTEPTLGVDFYVKEYDLSAAARQQHQQTRQTLNNRNNNTNGVVKAQFWDTSGQERFRCISASFYRGANAALLVYDITSMESFLNMKNIWINEFMLYCEKNSPIVAVVGNKSDQHPRRAVTTEMGMQYAQRNKFHFFETSALNGSCVFQAFDTIVEQLYIRDCERQQYRSTLLSMDDGGSIRKLSQWKDTNCNNNNNSNNSNSGCSC